MIGRGANADGQPAPDPSVAAENGATSGDEREAVSTFADDLLFAAGLRPISKRRLEAIAEMGTASQSAAVRASDRLAGMGFELTGSIDDREYQLEHLNTESTTARYAVRWTRGKLEAQAFGQTTRLHEDSAVTSQGVSAPTSTLGARIRVHSWRLDTDGIEHELSAGIGYVRASGTTSDDLHPDTPLHMNAPLRTTTGEHRFLDAYLQDTVRVIESLDVSTGFIVENWSFLSGTTSLKYGVFDEMDIEYPTVNELQFEPQLGALYRIDDNIALAARGTRSLRAPTLSELYRPILEGEAATAANPTLRPESIWSAEIGPRITAGTLEARAMLYRNEIERPISSALLADGTRQRVNLDHATITGLVTEASWRPAKAWLATVEYTFAASASGDKRLALTPQNRAAAILTYDNPRIATVTGSVRYVGRQFADASNTASLGAYTLVDAIAARKLHGGLAGFVAVENLLDRRYLAGAASMETFGAPRTLHVGLRLDTARF